MTSICLYYGYWEIFDYTPRSTHQWRQTDSASITFNYYQDGLNFFKPRTHYVMGGEGFVTGAGEAPFFYYFVALFYKVFGPHDGIYRLLSLLFLLGGLFLLAKIIVHETQDWFAPPILAGIIMGSPVIAFYSFNFTPNIPAQGVAMIGIWWFYRYYKTKQINLFYYSMLFYTLAGMIKISSLMSFAVILGLYFFQASGLLKRFSRDQVFHNLKKCIPGFLFVFTGLFFWKLWADHFNEVHKTKYFLSKTRPMWGIDKGTLLWVFKRIREVWFPSYLSPYTFWGLTGILGFLFITPRKHKTLVYLSLGAIFLGCLLFFVLWYQQFEGHDYYVIELILLPIAILGTFFLYLKNYFPKILSNTFFRIMLFVFLAYNVNYTKDQLSYRYDQESVFMVHFNPDLYRTAEVQSFLKGLGIHYTDQVVSAPDGSPNGTLYHYNLRGWTELYLGGEMHAPRVKQCAEAGAKYLIINDKKYLEKENLKEVLTHPLGNFNNSIFVYDLRPWQKSN